jgi:Tc toxin complex TcA C-terminal TcB-binding domain
VKHRHDYYDNLIEGGQIPEEKNQLLQLRLSSIFTSAGSALQALAGPLATIPRIETGNVGPQPVFRIDPVDGAKIARGIELAGSAAINTGSVLATGSSLSAINASFSRRADEWEQQRGVAEKEIKQIEKQIEAARVRVAIAERDFENHERQIENARSVREFMEQKFTSLELYQWMVGQLSSLYFQSYQMAYDLAKQTERAYRHELALPDATFIQFGYWDSLKKGLLAGERLQYDLERMDTAYLSNNVREYEVTKHVSLALLDPVALLQLQTAGSCEFSVPEALFDIDYPGHYLRRIKSVAVSIPCVTGPYTTVPARLTLVSSRTRVNPSDADSYPMVVSNGSTDQRFQFHTGAVQSIVVSAGREDAGLFTADYRDERYLPFEGTGAISDWNLTLTSAVRTFDWSTITDVVIHLRYTAREGGDLLRDAALKSIESELVGIPLQRSFSALHEFPTEWNAFLRRVTEVEAVLKLDLSEKRFPYFARGLEPVISHLELIALVKDPTTWNTDISVTAETAGKDPITFSLTPAPDRYGGNPSGPVDYGDANPGEWTVRVNTASLGPPSDWIDDFVVIATYQVTVPA